MSSLEHHCPVDYMVEGVRLYVENGIPPGGFLTALFSNDLKESYRRADYTNAAHMKDWASFMVNHMPSRSQGSPEAVAEWIKQGGLYGHAASQEARV